MIKKALITSMLVLLVCSCTSPQPVVSDTDEDGCIPPPYTVAFPVVTSDPARERRAIPPQGKWKAQDILPGGEKYFNNYLSNVGAVSHQQKLELWFVNGENAEIYRYSIENKKWNTYRTIESVQTIPTVLFAARDGTIWGAGRQLTDQLNWEKPYPLLSRFNDTADRFEFVPDNAGLLESSDGYRIRRIVEDRAGLLWFFVGSELYSFDPKTHTTQSHYRFEDASGDLAIAPNDSLWIRERDQLAQYIPSSKKVSFYKGESNDFDWYSFDVNKVVSLYFDHAGNLWLPAYGWLDFSNGDTPVWNQIITPPEFLVEKGVPESEYSLWATQIDMYQSSNGWYWFHGGGGIVRLDLQAGKWCMVSTGTGDVVEDVDHNLWIATFGRLYKYDLQGK